MFINEACKKIEVNVETPEKYNFLKVYLNANKGSFGNLAVKYWQYGGQHHRMNDDRI